MKFQFAGSQREIEATRVTTFDVVQDNRKKTVTVLEYETSRGTGQMTFLNGIEASLNNKGRYVQAKSKRDDCAKILVEPKEEAEEAA